MSFWKSSAGEVLGTQQSAFAKSFKNIPDGSTALAKIKDFKHDDYMGDKYLQITWVIIDGDFTGKHVFQKLRVFDKDEKKRWKALNMFMYIYKLLGLIPNSDEAPSDKDLMEFTGKEAGIKIRETEPNQNGKQYNWVSEIHDKKGFVTETAVSTVVTHVNKPIQSGEMWTQKPDNNDLPF
jgi:hypothetical protein